MSNDALFQRADRAVAETRRLLAWAEAARLSIAQFGQPGIVFPEPPPREDQLSVARRHVAEAERHIANQQLVLAKFDRGVGDDLAANGWILLSLLEDALRLARNDLARIEGETWPDRGL